MVSGCQSRAVRLLSSSEQIVYAIGERKSSSDFMQVSGLMKEAFDQIDRLFHMHGEQTGLPEGEEVAEDMQEAEVKEAGGEQPPPASAGGGERAPVRPPVQQGGQVRLEQVGTFQPHEEKNQGIQTQQTVNNPNPGSGGMKMFRELFRVFFRAIGRKWRAGGFGFLFLDLADYGVRREQQRRDAGGVL